MRYFRLFLLLCAACSSASDAAPPPSATHSKPASSDPCQPACKKLVGLKCPDAPADAMRVCLDGCAVIPDFAACVQRASTCDASSACVPSDGAAGSPTQGGSGSAGAAQTGTAGTSGAAGSAGGGAPDPCVEPCSKLVGLKCPDAPADAMQVCLDGCAAIPMFATCIGKVSTCDAAAACVPDAGM